jgi:hypothetical protein
VRRRAPNGARSGCVRLPLPRTIGWRRGSIRLLPLGRCGFCRLAVAPEFTSERDHPGPVHRDRHTDLAPAVAVTIVESCGAALREELPQVVRGRACEFTGWRWPFLRFLGGKTARSDRLAARLPQRVAPRACEFSRLAAPYKLSSGRDLAGEPIVTQRVLVVRHGRCRHRTGSLGRGQLHSTPHGLASNDSLKLSRRPNRPTGAPSSAWAALQLSSSVRWYQASQ